MPQRSVAPPPSAGGTLSPWSPPRDGFGFLPPANIPYVEKHLWIANLAGVQVYTVTDPDQFEVEERFQSLEKLTWRLAGDHPAVDYIDIDYTVTFASKLYVVTVVEPLRAGSETWVEYEAEALWVKLVDDIHPGDFVVSPSTPAVGLVTILSGSGWSSLGAPGGTATFGMTMTDQSTLALVREWAKVTGTEVLFDTVQRTVKLETRIGSINQLAVRYGRNLRGIRKRNESPRCTKLWAYGRASLPVNASGYITNYSYYTGQGLSSGDAIANFTKEQVWVDESFIDQAALSATATARLAVLSQPKITYDCDVADLSDVTGFGESSPFRLGDTVRVTDGSLNIDVQTRVARLVTRPLDPSRNVVELASAFDPTDSAQSSGSRGGLGDSWYHLQNNNVSTTSIDSYVRTNTIIAVEFTDNGIARHQVFVQGTASAATGTLQVELYDDQSAMALRTVSYPFVANEAISIAFSWAHENLVGTQVFSVRTKTTAGTGTVAITTGSIHQNILVQGGLGVSVPASPTQSRFDYNGTTGSDGAVQTFTVPDGVYKVTIDAWGARGNGGSGTQVKTGRGAQVWAVDVPVTPFEVLYVYCGGGWSGSQNQGFGFNGGGAGGYPGYGSCGGGASDVRRAPYGLADRLVVAGGGGGQTGRGAGPYAGDAGFNGENADPGYGDMYGRGATQSAGGAPGTGDTVNTPFATAGSFGQGGRGGAAQPVMDYGGGGGGGGWYGGGGGAGRDYGSGGGGSSHESGTALHVLYATGVNTGHGFVIFTWNAA